jgi:hypothetical protein
LRRAACKSGAPPCPGSWKQRALTPPEVRGE